MEWQGKIDFQKPITINGKPHGIEHLATIPVWTSEDKGRIVHTEGNDNLYIGTSTEWFEMLHSVEAHNHDDMYYTKANISNYFNGVSVTGKLQIQWLNVIDRPSTYPATEHEHTQYFLESNVTFEAFNTKGLMGIGSNKFAIGNHLHTGTYSPVGHTHEYVLTTDFNAAFSGTDINTGKQQIEWDNVINKELNFAPTGHDHDHNYYLKTLADSTFVKVSYMVAYETNIQDQFTNYYTNTETDSFLNLKSNSDHLHEITYAHLIHEHDSDYANIIHGHSSDEISFEASMTPFPSATVDVTKALKELALMKFSSKNEIYIDPNYDLNANKGRGSDGTIDAPFKNIGAAISDIGTKNYKSDIIIHIASGSPYVEDFTLPSNVSLIGENGVIISGTITCGAGICTIKNISAKAITTGGNTTLENVTIDGSDSTNKVLTNGSTKMVSCTVNVPIELNTGALIIDTCVITAGTAGIGSGILSKSGSQNIVILNSIIASPADFALNLSSAYNIVDNCIITAAPNKTAVYFKTGNISKNKLSSCTVFGDINISGNVGLVIAGLIHKSGTIIKQDTSQIEWDIPPAAYRAEILDRSREFGGLSLNFDEFKTLKKDPLGLDEDQNYFISTREVI